MDENIVIRHGSIDPSDSKSIENIMKDYPNYYPVMILVGEIHLALVKEN